MKSLVFLLAILATGCASSDFYHGMMEQDGALRAQPVSAPDHDYVVTIRATPDIGYNANDKATRDKTALHYLRSSCPRGRIIGEQVFDQGTYWHGGAKRTYYIRVSCR